MIPPESNPLISIAMCTYNGERFLREQLDSLIAQDHRPLEIIIVDDGSTDQTCSIIQEYVDRHEWIDLHRNEINLGVVKNFEKALNLCTGEYIGFCDQDDLWLPHKISAHLVDIGNASLTYSQLSYIDENGHPLLDPPRKTNRLSGRCPLALLFHTCVTGHIALFKREVLNHALPFPDGTQAHDHWVPFIAAALNGLHASDQVLSLYRVHGKNVSMKKRGKGRKSLYSRIRERKELFHSKLNTRLIFLRSARRSKILTPDESQLIATLEGEFRKLTDCIQNTLLRRLLKNHAKQLLPLYKNPGKMAARLSRGYYYYASSFWSRKP